MTTPIRIKSPYRIGRFIVRKLPGGKIIHGILFDYEEKDVVRWYGSFVPYIQFPDRAYINIINKENETIPELYVHVKLPNTLYNKTIDISDGIYFYRPAYIEDYGYGSVLLADCSKTSLEYAGIPEHASLDVYMPVKNLRPNEIRRLSFVKSDFTCETAPYQNNTAYSASNSWYLSNRYGGTVGDPYVACCGQVYSNLSQIFSDSTHTSPTGNDITVFGTSNISTGGMFSYLPDEPSLFLTESIKKSPYGWVFEGRIISNPDTSYDEWCIAFSIARKDDTWSFGLAADYNGQSTEPHLVIAHSYAHVLWNFKNYTNKYIQFLDIYSGTFGDPSDVFFRLINDIKNNRIILYAKSMVNGVEATLTWDGFSFPNTGSNPYVVIIGGGHGITKYYVTIPRIRPLYDTIPSSSVPINATRPYIPLREKSILGKAIYLEGRDRIILKPSIKDLSPKKHSVLLIFKPKGKTKATLFSKSNDRPKIVQNTDINKIQFSFVDVSSNEKTWTDDEPIDNYIDRYRMIGYSFDVVENKINIFKDAKLVDEVDWTGNDMKILPGDIIIGDNFLGFIDEVYITNNYLTEQDVKIIYSWRISRLR